MYCLGIERIDRGPSGLLGLLGQQLLTCLQFCGLCLSGLTLIEALIERRMSLAQVPPQAVFGGIGAEATSAGTGKSVSLVRGLRLLLCARCRLADRPYRPIGGAAADHRIKRQSLELRWHRAVSTLLFVLAGPALRIAAFKAELAILCYMKIKGEEL